MFIYKHVNKQTTRRFKFSLLSARSPRADLLPPKFERQQELLDRLSRSPFDYSFGKKDRDVLFNSLVAQPRTVGVSLHVKPDPDGPVFVKAAAEFDAGRSSLFSPHIQLGYESPRVAGGERPMLYLGKVQLGADNSSTFASAIALERESGVCGFISASGNAIVGGGSPSLQTHQLVASDIDVGMRWMPPERPFSVGFHASPISPHPLKFWAVGAFGQGGAVRAGVQARTDAARWRVPEIACDPSAIALAPIPRFDIDAAISVSQPRAFDVSLALDGARGEVVAGYLHHLSVRRRVLNPLAEANVVGIWNYIDLGVELRRQLRPPFANTATLGAGWQVNKNIMVKGRIGSSGAAATVALKTWWDPAVTLSVSTAYDASRRESMVGLRIGVESGLGKADYTKAKEGVHVVQNVPLLAQPQLSESSQRKVDMEPYDRKGGSTSQRATVGEVRIM